jgi:hypothetical protein
MGFTLSEANIEDFISPRTVFTRRWKEFSEGNHSFFSMKTRTEIDKYL